MFKLFLKTLGALALVVSAGGSPAAAAPITVSFEGVSPGIGNAGQYNWNSGATNFAGVVYTPFGNGSLSANHFVTFCIEQNQHIGGGTTYGNYSFSNLEDSPVPGPAMPASAPDDIRAMWAQYRGGVDTNAESAAFQHAVWHLVDPSYNPSLSGSELSFYNTYLNSGSWLSGLANLATMVSSSNQDQLLELQRGYFVDGGGNIVTPAPATLAIAALMAPALLLRRRTRTA